jgi:hypothetical protein
MISRLGGKKLLLMVAVGALVAVPAVAAAADTAPDPCARVRDQVTSRTLLLDAATEAGGLTSVQRSQIANERAINSAAMRKCGPAPSPSISTPGSPSPSASAATPTPAPTVSSSPTANPTPTGAECPAFPAFPDEACTGWRHTGVALTAYTGPLTITAAGTVIDSKVINGDLCIRANNVTVSRTQIKGTVETGSGTPYGACPSPVLPTNAVLRDVEIAGPGTTTMHNVGIAATFAMSGDNFTCLRCDVHGWGSGFYVKHNVTIQDSYVHDTVGYQGCSPVLGPDCIAHRSGIGGNGAVNAKYLHNRVQANNLNGEEGMSGAIVVYSQKSFLPAKDVLVQNNLLIAEQASYCLYAGVGDTAASNVQIIGNRFNKSSAWPQCGLYGPYVSGGGGVTLVDNAYTDGTPIK